MEKPQVVKEFKNIFDSIFPHEVPIFSLESFPFWRNEWLEQSSSNVALLNGCFLNFSSPFPTSEQLNDVVLHDAGQQILVPNVRLDPNLKKHDEWEGYEISCGYEMIYEISDDKLDSDIRKKIGSKPTREIFRLHRRATENTTLERYSIETLLENSPLSVDVDQVFLQHEQRYGHTMRVYGLKYLQAALETEYLSKRLQVWVRRDQDGDVLQVMLLLIPDEKQTIYYIAQAINKESISKNLNVYKSAFIDIYLFAQSHGYKAVNLGRSPDDYKIKHLGATIKIPQSHFLLKRKRI